MCPPLNAANDDLLHLEITPKRSFLSGRWGMICWFFQKKCLCALSLFRTRLKQPRIKQILALNKTTSRLLLQKTRSVMMMLAVWNKVGSGGEVGSCAAQAARSRNSSTSLQLIHPLIFSSSTGTYPQSCPCRFPLLFSHRCPPAQSFSLDLNLRELWLWARVIAAAVTEVTPWVSTWRSGALLVTRMDELDPRCQPPHIRSSANFVKCEYTLLGQLCLTGNAL